MSFPGLPNRGLGGDSTAGMSDQEAKMVKAVRFALQIQEKYHFSSKGAKLTRSDASSDGELCRQDSSVWCHGLRSWRCVRALHVECM